MSVKLGRNVSEIVAVASDGCNLGRKIWVVGPKLVETFSWASCIKNRVKTGLTLLEKERT
ncbi:MAG: hypothetical protein ACP5U1_01705 [Desulfomonilaceae bacterium]